MHCVWALPGTSASAQPARKKESFCAPPSTDLAVSSYSRHTRGRSALADVNRFCSSSAARRAGCIGGAREATPPPPATAGCRAPPSEGAAEARLSSTIGQHAVELPLATMLHARSTVGHPREAYGGAVQPGGSSDSIAVKSMVCAYHT